MTCYSEMNKQICGILRISDEPASQYAADRIEELEEQLADCKQDRDNFIDAHHDRQVERDGYYLALKTIKASTNSNLAEGWLYCVKVARKALEGEK